MPVRLPRSFYQRDPVTVARELLGQTLVHITDNRRRAGIIVETEAYLGSIDKAAHTYNGRHTTRNHVMYLDGGHAYVYFTYGMHYCINAVAGLPDEPVAVLLRALEPNEGLDLMHLDRPKARRDADLCSGPAKLTQALHISRSHDGIDMTQSHSLFIEQTRLIAHSPRQIVSSPRIGVEYADEWAKKRLRFYLRGNANVSR